MILNIIHGDITSPQNLSDIVIGMNSQLQDVTGIGLQFVRSMIPAEVIKLGTVISFDFDTNRKLHMIICHDLGKGGWNNSDRFVRFGLDYLYHLDNEGRTYSIVQVGTGRVGKRDGANPATILTAISTSFLPLDLYIFTPPEGESVRAELPVLTPLTAWTHMGGEVRLNIPA